MPWTFNRSNFTQISPEVTEIANKISINNTHNFKHYVGDTYHLCEHKRTLIIAFWLITLFGVVQVKPNPENRQALNRENVT